MFCLKMEIMMDKNEEKQRVKQRVNEILLYEMNKKIENIESQIEEILMAIRKTSWYWETKINQEKKKYAINEIKSKV